MVSPTKYANAEIAREFKKIETHAELECLASLPEEFRDEFAGIVVQDNVDPVYKKIVKAADILVAYTKAKDELNHHNHEFVHVEERLGNKLDKLKVEMPEVAYFLDTFLDACSTTVDKLVAK